MKRRRLLVTLSALPVAQALSKLEPGADLADPYAGVEWGNSVYVHSMSHQHQGQTESSREVFYQMGYRHFAFSNYYPSAPTYPLPPEYLRKHPDLVAAPNAEHHSFPDSGLHCNALGSLLATGYGSSLSGAERAVAPLHHEFTNLHVFDTARPWLGVYRLDIGLAALDKGDASSVLTIEGATECDFRQNFADKGPVRDRVLAAGSHTIYLRTTAAKIETQLTYEKTALTVTQYRLMQGANRPWRDVFRAALDGEMIDGRRHGGLLYADGGGLTLNHPTRTLGDYATMLDFDPRVLGIEVWNQLTSGFGSNKGFYDADAAPPLHFYRLWDDILRTGRRCWGFFVKDHNTYGRGRNVLVLPKTEAAPEAREAGTLRAYRQGAFYGSIAAIATNEAGEAVAPFDHSEFRFSHIRVRRDAAGQALMIEAAVTGNDPEKRPQIQLRFVTDQGVELIADAAEAEFPLKRDADGKLVPLFIRIEAFAYPRSHLGGEPLTPEMLRGMNVGEIALLHDRMSTQGAQFSTRRPELRTPIPIVDMIFSQPLRRV